MKAIFLITILLVAVPTIAWADCRNCTQVAETAADICYQRCGYSIPRCRHYCQPDDRVCFENCGAHDAQCTYACIGAPSGHGGVVQ
jgi:hypothetical protein